MGDAICGESRCASVAMSRSSFDLLLAAIAIGRALASGLLQPGKSLDSQERKAWLCLMMPDQLPSVSS